MKESKKEGIMRHLSLAANLLSQKLGKKVGRKTTYRLVFFAKIIIAVVTV
jgi:hypothetical protein